MILSAIVKCRICHRMHVYRAERYAALQAAIDADYRKWDRRAGTAECRSHAEEKHEAVL